MPQLLFHKIIDIYFFTKTLDKDGWFTSIFLIREQEGFNFLTSDLFWLVRKIAVQSHICQALIKFYHFFIFQFFSNFFQFLTSFFTALYSKVPNWCIFIWFKKFPFREEEFWINFISLHCTLNKVCYIHQLWHCFFLLDFKCLN